MAAVAGYTGNSTFIYFCFVLPNTFFYLQSQSQYYSLKQTLCFFFKSV